MRAAGRTAGVRRSGELRSSSGVVVCVRWRDSDGSLHSARLLSSLLWTSAQTLQVIHTHDTRQIKKHTLNCLTDIRVCVFRASEDQEKTNTTYIEENQPVQGV